MRTSLWLLVASLLLTGCATSTIESRRRERFAAYSTLSPEHRLVVDAGQIKVGMKMELGVGDLEQKHREITSEVKAIKLGE